MIMPEVLEKYDKNLYIDVLLNSPWKDYNEILEEPFKSQGFIKITKKGLKIMTTFPFALLLGDNDKWE